MSDLWAQIMTPEVTAAFTIVVIFLVIIYILSIIWVVRDAYMRGSTWLIWGIVALVPIAGVIAYCLLRPPLLQIDRDEQELEVALKKRELMRYGECAVCGYPVDEDYVLCPNCHTQLRNLCATCNHALDPAWTICPYCATPVGAPSSLSGSASNRRASSSKSSRAATSSRAPKASAMLDEERPVNSTGGSAASAASAASATSAGRASSPARRTSAPRSRSTANPRAAASRGASNAATSASASASASAPASVQASNQ